MLAQGLTEEEILADFEEQRRQSNKNTNKSFDALCDEVSISVSGTRLTRDQLHERR